jgi:gas vesicle protein
MDLPTIDPTKLNSVGNLVESAGSALGLNKITDAISGGFGTLGGFFKKLSGTKLPLPNPLFAYASYDYVLGLACLSPNEINNPDSTYMAGKPVKLICKSANSDPNNRIKTAYGKFDFFIDNVQLKSLIGFEGGNNSNVATISFDIIEPYSMGMFFISCEQAALIQGHESWREAPFLLTIEFRGNKETGQIANIPNTKRSIPFMFADISMTADKDGSKYSCKAMAWGGGAITDSVKQFKTDINAQGKTVQEILQTGENSVQASMNKKYKKQALDNNLETADEVLIYFPTEVASDVSAVSGGKAEDISFPAVQPMGSVDLTATTAVFKKLGVSRSDINGTLVQDTANAIGNAPMRLAAVDSPITKDNKAYATTAGGYVRALNTSTTSETTLSFAQSTDVLSAINNTILNSAFADTTLQSSNIDATGMRNCWLIVPQQYFISDKANVATGEKAKLHVFKIIPYKTHNSKIIAANVKPAGYDNLNGQVVKEYNYLYTGKNVDVLDFKIAFNFSFTAMLPASSNSQSTDTSTSVAQGDGAKPQATVNPMSQGRSPEPGTMSQVTKFVQTLTGTDLTGGGGAETQATRSARVWFDALTRGEEMTVLRMKIIGDPYFIVQSGMGNYASAPTQYQNLNSDGTVNAQSGEVDIRVNFRTPIDINQSTGLYTFAGSTKSAPVSKFSGIYQLCIVNSSFRGGEFRQELKALRRPLQESKRPEATPSETYNNNPDAVDKRDPLNVE